MSQQIWALTALTYNGDEYSPHEEELLAASTSLDSIMREMEARRVVYHNTPLILQFELTDADRRGLEPYTLIVHPLPTI